MALAPQCAVCHAVLDRPLAGAVCAGCWACIRRLVPPLCRHCGDELPSWRPISVAGGECAHCRRAHRAVDCARSVGRYEGSLRGILHAFKYEGRQSLARPLAALLRSAGDPVLEDADWAVPVPLHPWRHAQRGFNQSHALAKRLGIPVVRALWRVRATAPQTSLRASARRRNVQGAFTLSPLIRPRATRLLEGRVLVLVDDVWTTGATLAACATVLRDAGAAQVRALTVARAPSPSAHREGITAARAA